MLSNYFHKRHLCSLNILLTDFIIAEPKVQHLALPILNPTTEQKPQPVTSTPHPPNTYRSVILLSPWFSKWPLSELLYTFVTASELHILSNTTSSSWAYSS